MQNVPKRKSRSYPHLRLMLIILLLLMLTILLLLNRNSQQSSLASAHVARPDYRVLLEYDPEEVQSIKVCHRSGDTWEVSRQQDGRFADEHGLTIDETLEKNLLAASSIIDCADIVSENADDYQQRLDEFGLLMPYVTVDLTYSDGRNVSMQIGDRFTHTDAAYYYMTWSEDDILYAVDTSTRQDWEITANLLHSVPDLSLQASRITEILMQRGEEELSWLLTGDLTDESASDHWQITAPYHYPADGNAMQSLLSAIESLRFGALEAEATEENLKNYGFTSPRAILRVHMDSGMGTRLTQDGAVETVSFPAEDVTLTVGDMRGDFIDYVLYEHFIYRISHLTLGPVIEKQAKDTLSRYLVQVSGENVERLLIQEDGKDPVTYTIVSDLSGNAETAEKHCFENEAEIDMDTFLARFYVLEMATVSGWLSDDGFDKEKPRETITIEDTSGRKYRIALIPWNTQYDAVQLDDLDILFYLARGALELPVSTSGR